MHFRLFQFLFKNLYIIIYQSQKQRINTELETINGIGEKTVIELLKHFKSAKRVANAKLDELEDVIGKSRAERVYSYYNEK